MLIDKALKSIQRKCIDKEARKLSMMNRIKEQLHNHLNPAFTYMQILRNIDGETYAHEGTELKPSWAWLSEFLEF